MNEDDLSNVYTDKVRESARVSGASEMEGWMREMETGAQPPVQVEPVSKPTADKGRPLPEPDPVRKKTEDTLGRGEPTATSVLGDVARGVAELPRQAVGGVDDAARNALGFLDPLTNWLNENVADLRYSPVAPAKTVGGNLTRKVSEFLTGFIPAMRGLRAVGMSGNVAAPMIAGAIADFTVRDPHEGRLSDLWNEAGLPVNVLTDYMKSDPADSGVEARLKNVAEGVFTGLALEGVLLGARALRAAKSTPGVKAAEDEILRAKYGDVPDEEFKRVIGDPSKPGIEIKYRRPSVAGEKMADAVDNTPDLAPRSLIRKKGVENANDDFDVYINFANIEAPEQVKFVIGKMAEAMKPTIDEAKRGVISMEETTKMAEAMGMSVTDLLARRKGQAFNAEEAVASRQLWTSSAERLLELAKVAAGKNAGPIDQFAFRRQMAVHSAIQSEVLGARAEAGRALNSWKILAEGGTERARAVDQVMKAMGGTESSQELARRIAILAEVGDPAALAKFVERGWGATTMDAVKEVWVNGLLSSPKTHAVNMASNLLVAAQQVYERQAAGAIRSFVGGDGVVPGEAVAMTYGAVESVKDAFRLAAKALKTGESGWAFNKVDTQRTGAVSAEAFRMGSETGLGRFVDFLGTTVNVPGRLLGAEDEFFKTIGYRMELRAQALRQATGEGKQGAELAARVQELTDAPTEAMRINSADSALYSTFTSEMGNFGRAMMNVRNESFGGALSFVMPFVRTPINIARYAFERTPFAPLVGQWRDDIAAGGARADLALARMSTGTAIMMVAMDLADSGKVTGDGPRGQDKEVREALQRQGWLPYSMQVGDRWYSYNRTDPLGMTLGFAASISEAVKKGEIDKDEVDEWWEVTAMAIAAVSQVTISKTYLEGIANLVEVVSDPKRYSRDYIQNLFASFLPATALSSSIKNVVDPTQREAGSPMEAVQARIAGLSANLPPRRDLWGREITSESGLGKVYDFLSPVQSKHQDVSPIDREIVRLGSGPDRINKRSPFDGVQANFRFYPKAYDEYVRLAGNDLKHPAWGLGAKDYLDAVVSGAHPMSAAYKFMSDESRKGFIMSTISDYRRLAQQEIMQQPQFNNFAQEIQFLKQSHQQQRMPVLEN